MMAANIIGNKRKIASDEKPFFINLADDATTDSSIIDLTIDSDDELTIAPASSYPRKIPASQRTLPVLFGMECKLIKLRSKLPPRRRLETPRQGHAFEIIDLANIEEDGTDDAFMLYVRERFGPQANRKRQLTIEQCSQTQSTQST